MNDWNEKEEDNRPVTNDITPAQCEELGASATALIINIMQHNQAETAAVTTSLYNSVLNDLAKARDTIDRIQSNVLVTLAVPHTDNMLRKALYADHYYESDGPK